MGSSVFAIAFLVSAYSWCKVFRFKKVAALRDARHVVLNHSWPQTIEPKENLSLPKPKIEPNGLTKILNKRHRLDTHHIKPFAASNVLATHRVIPTHHITLRLGKTRPVAVIGTTWELRLLPPHYPFNLVVPLLPAVRTGHHMRSLFRPLIKKVAFFHPTPHSVSGSSYEPNPICNPASDAPLQARVMHNHAWASKPGTNAGRISDE
jgi:hypothetical protein